MQNAFCVESCSHTCVEADPARIRGLRPTAPTDVSVHLILRECLAPDPARMRALDLILLTYALEASPPGSELCAVVQGAGFC